MNLKLVTILKYEVRRDHLPFHTPLTDRAQSKRPQFESFCPPHIECFFLIFVFFYLFAGAFLIPYLLTLVVCGVPLVYFETFLGQFASAGCISVFNLNPLFKGDISVQNILQVQIYSSCFINKIKKLLSEIFLSLFSVTY